MMPRAKKTGRCTSCAASRIFCTGVRVSSAFERWRTMFSIMTTRAVDDHAEVQCTERKQIGRNMAQVKADGGEKQRKGDGERDDDGAAHVAQEQKQNDRDEDHAFGQVVFHGFDREIHQLGAIEEGN